MRKMVKTAAPWIENTRYVVILPFVAVNPANQLEKTRSTAKVTMETLKIRSARALFSASLKISASPTGSTIIPDEFATTAHAATQVRTAKMMASTERFQNFLFVVSFIRSILALVHRSRNVRGAFAWARTQQHVLVTFRNRFYCSSS